MNKKLLKFLPLILFTCSFLAISQEIYLKVSPPPVVVETFPKCGDENVDPGLTEIKIVFSQDMNTEAMSWVYETQESFPELDGMPQFTDKKTCVAKVKLKPNKTYWVWLNKGEYQNFVNTKRQPSLPYLLVFKTKE